MAGFAPLRLLGTRRFAPLFWTQAFGGFNDSLFKQAMALMLAFRAGSASTLGPAALTALAGATFVAPFIVLSALAGDLADTMDKGTLARRLKLAELGLMALAALALFVGNVVGLFAVLLLLGCQAALFGPVKYSLLPAHLAEGELVEGNALIEGATFVAILLGSILGGSLIGSARGAAFVSGAILAVAVGGVAASRLIPPAPPVARAAASNARRPGTLAILREVRANRPAWLSILGISWFWALGATLLSFTPPLARDLLGGDEATASLLLGLFSVGIAVGSLLCARVLKGEISARPVPFAALAVSGLLVVFAIAAAALPAPAALGRPVLAVLASPGALTVSAVLFLLAVAAGFYAVPLFAILQHAAPDDAKARAIGANNVVNSLFMVAAALALAVLSSGLGLGLPALALALAGLNLVAAVISVRLLSREVLKAVVRALLTLVYGVEVRGAAEFDRAGPRRIVVANHQSFVDGLVVAAFLPGDPVFAIDTLIASKWWSRPLLSLVDFATVDPSNPMSLKFLTREVERGRTLVIFPEGRLTVTGALMKVYDGPGLIADRTGADVIPVRLDGLQHTPFTRLAGRAARRLRPKVRMTVLPPRQLAVDPAIQGRDRRKAAEQVLYDLMSDMMFRTSPIERTLFGALADAAALNGRRYVIAEDIGFAPLSYGRLMAGAFALGAKLDGLAPAAEPVGVLLPNSVGALVTFFALQARGRVPAMLNLSAGAGGMASACRVAGVSTVLSSRRFVERAKLDDTVAQLGRTVRIVYLEDLRDRIGRRDKLAALARSFVPNRAAARRDPSDPAVVLFTSGSEGTPKGVVLTHRNLHANRFQVNARIAFNTSDIAFNALPMFHSFGLTVGTLLPVLAGIRTFLYPSPLHYRVVPELVYQTNATILFGTDTFLRGYAKAAHPYDFQSVRIVGAGAERVGEDTRRVWMDRFGLRILEGYGATETAPVIAFNSPMHARNGTVGRLMPGMELRLDPVEGIAEGGRLVVRGPNVMAGYLRDTAPGVLEPVGDGWYDTGDIVTVDADGFIAIRGRAKRFAKIAGEMVSLGAVEELATRASPGFRHAALARPDPRKGEAVVLVSEDPGLTRDRLQAAAAEAGLPEILLPREVFSGRPVPALGTGKTDYVALAASLADKDRRAAA